MSENDPTGRRLGDDGAKMDSGKAPVFTGLLAYFPRALQAVAEVSAAGIAKGYAPMSWRAVPNGFERYSDALLRHVLKEAMDPPRPADEPPLDNGTGGTGLPHAALAAWNALARLELMLRGDAALGGREGSMIGAGQVLAAWKSGVQDALNAVRFNDFGDLMPKSDVLKRVETLLLGAERKEGTNG